MTASAADGVGKKVAAQGFPARVFHPIFGPRSFSNAKVFARLKRDASRKKILRWLLGERIPVEASATERLTRRGERMPLATPGKKAAHHHQVSTPSPALPCAFLKVPWCLVHPARSSTQWRIQSLLARPRVVAIRRACWRHPLAGFGTTARAPSPMETQAWIVLRYSALRSRRPDCASPDVGRVCDDSQSLGRRQYMRPPSRNSVPLGVRSCQDRHACFSA